MTREEKQKPFINKPCICGKICEHDKNQVLENIRTEISQKAMPNSFLGRTNGKAIRVGLCMALEIINKYRIEGEK